MLHLTGNNRSPCIHRHRRSMVPEKSLRFRVRLFVLVITKVQTSLHGQRRNNKIVQKKPQNKRQEIIPLIQKSIRLPNDYRYVLELTIFLILWVGAFISLVQLALSSITANSLLKLYADLDFSVNQSGPNLVEL